MHLMARLRHCCCLLGSALLLAGCGSGEGNASSADAGGAGEMVVSLLPAVQGSADAEDVAGVAAAIRYRLERVGFEGVSVNTLPNDELLVRFSSSPSSEKARKIMDKAFLNCGVLELRHLHPDSRILVANLKRLAQAGSGWWVAPGESGGRHVVGDEILLGSKHVTGVEIEASSIGLGFDVVVGLDPQGSRILGELRARIGLRPLALLIDRKAVAAPLPARALKNDSIFVVRGVSEAEARELAFVLGAPLVVPLQTKG